MPASNVLLQPWGQKLRSYLWPEGHAQYVMPITGRRVTAQVMASTFRIAGVASGNHNLAYMVNSSGSSVIVALLGWRIQSESTAVRTTLSPAVQSFKVTSSLPTGGTNSTKHLTDSADSSASNCNLVGASSAEGTASTITWSVPSGTPAQRQGIIRLHTGVGQVLFDDNQMAHESIAENPIILRAGEAFVAQVNIAYATSAHYIINAFWEEYTLP